MDEALPKDDNPKLRKKRDNRLRGEIREMRRLIEKQRRWLRDLLLIESENLPKRSMIDFEKKRRWCGWCRKERNDTSFETYIKTRIESLRILCRDHETNESGAGSGGGDDKAMSKRSKKNRGEKLASGKEDSNHDLLPDSNLLRIAMLEMYKVRGVRARSVRISPFLFTHSEDSLVSRTQPIDSPVTRLCPSLATIPLECYEKYFTRASRSNTGTSKSKWTGQW